MAQAEQLRVQGDAHKAEQAKNQAQEVHIRAEDSQQHTQNLAIAELKQQISVVQAQSQRQENLVGRLAILDVKNPVGLVAGVSKP